jgi:Domain of unknown function (DUF4134)
MKQLVKSTQEQRFFGASSLFLFIPDVGATEALQMFSIVMVFVTAFTGIIGAVKVSKKLKNGASDIQATAITWFGSFLILTIINTVMRHFII